MKIRGINLNLRVAAVAIMLLLQGCGQDKGPVKEGESFAATITSVSSPQPSATSTDEAPADKKTIQNKVTVASPASSAQSTSVPEVTATAEQATVTRAPESKAKEKTNLPESSTKPTAVPSASPTLKPKRVTVAPPEKTAPTAPTAVPTSSSEPKVAVSTEKPDIQGLTGIGWSDFFDGEDQTRPSERFWDLQGSQVTIKGFMGEVLSFEKNWFLLIPEPGAECPFDNGDETYWNKIMIVFVPEDVKLRYKSGPLQITGRLDVGIKIDDSGYKTMFRLYDASFKEIE